MNCSTWNNYNVIETKAKSSVKILMKKYISFGHFGKGTGAAKNGLDEYEICKAFVSLILSQVARRDEYITKREEKNLKEVVSRINSQAEDISLAVEFHLNAGGGTGCSVVVSPKTSKENRHKAAELACIVSDALEIRNRGVTTSNRTPRKRLAFVDGTRCAAMICEICFIDSVNDMRRYNEKQKVLAANVAEWLDSI